MRPAWSVILLTTLIGAGQGLFLVVYALDLTRRPPGGFVVLGCGVAVVLCVLGLAASFFHLGRPERAWRAASQWRTSWLSREVIVLPAFMGSVLLYLFSRSSIVGVIAAMLCLALYFCTGMIYACLRFLQEWRTPLTPLNFTLLGLASGATLSVLVAVAAWPQFAGPLALAAFGLAALAFVMRCAAYLRNARLRPKSTNASAIGVASSKIAQRAQGFMGGSFNTREFFHGRPAGVLWLARAAFLVLAFPAPAWLLGWSGGGEGAFAAAFALQFAGLVADRWLFFAEARHPQNLYYQSMA